MVEWSLSLLALPVAHPGLWATWGTAGAPPPALMPQGCPDPWPQLHHKWPFALATLISVQVSWLRQ